MSKKKKTQTNAAKTGPERKLVTTNRRARFDFDILDTYEAGIVLTGTEVKSLREGKCNITDAYAEIYGGEARVHNLHITEYDYGTWTNHRPRRIRKLLLHRIEIAKLEGKLSEAGVTLIPLSVYFSGGWAKMELALARGRKSHDKRQAIAKREAQREIERSAGLRTKGKA
ncbi:SsrA-binding protein SmpB [Natronoglycomyces albus]|uniref:SsrA-binding protein n=1 Tax=Natronoglycomyces albus TaxID=2811108 RepID=A0A895XGT9_9ACTN|nr:SsrA-binding protein SmpB [Natronoglycomyces albus]QSB04564.1 SsrA-binding protein SmpB [Natronoglycomyces albus]